MIDVLTLNYNDCETTSRFVDSVKGYLCVSHVLVVDNNSSDGSAIQLKKIESKKVRVLCNDHNGGYGYGNNIGIKWLKEHCNSKYILLANPDVYVDEITLRKMESFLDCNKEYALVAPIMLDKNGKIQYNTAFKIPKLWNFILSLDLFVSKLFKPYYYSDLTTKKNIVKDVDAVSGSMFMMNVEKMLSYGMFDERVFLYCEELILGMKLKKCGFKTGLLCDSFFTHNHSVSISKTYKSIYSKRKLMMISSLFVIKHYYKAHFFARLCGCLLAKLSLLEVLAITFVRKKEK